MKYLSKCLVLIPALALLCWLGQPTPAAAADTLQVVNSSGWPGMSGYVIPIKLRNTTTLRALMFRMQVAPDSLVITGVTTTTRTAGFQVDAVQIAKGARVLLTPMNGSTPYLMPDSTAIINIQVSVKANTPGGTKATVTLDSIIASNTSNQSVALGPKTGYFWFGTKGDVKYDAAVNLFDVLRLIDIALGIQPAPSLYELWAGDLNIVDGVMTGDGLIDVIDISIALDLVVSGTASKQPVTEQAASVGSLRLEVADLPQNYKGQLEIPVFYRASAPVSGIELVIKTDAKTYHLAPPKKTTLSKNMTLQAALRGEEMRIVLCSTDGKPLPAGEGELLSLPVNLLSPLDEAVAIEIKHAQAGSQGASRLETIYGQAHPLQVEAPDSYSLSQNSPNPFNLSTTIRYEIPSSVEGSVETKVLVFNTQGQLVRTLEHRQRTAGRYTIVWDGMDDYGRYVSTGIYFYKLIAGDVIFTKKMAVMK